jgi:hypothetical protein
VNSEIVANSTIKYGGGIFNNGTLTITESEITQNTVIGDFGQGGGVSIQGGTVTLNASTVLSNSASFNGGGIYLEDHPRGDEMLVLNYTRLEGNVAAYGGGGGMYSGSVLTVMHSTFVNNAARYGGGMVQKFSSATITDSAFLRNHATKVTGASGGGGLYNEAEQMTIARTVFDGNESTTEGGGLVNVMSSAIAQDLRIGESTFSNNTSGTLGGAIFNLKGAMTLANSTVTLNRAGTHGGGITTQAQLSLVNTTITANRAPKGAGLDTNKETILWNTILANNVGANCDALKGLNDQGHNLDSGNTCTLKHPTSLKNTDAKLDTAGLQDNGGPTNTIALEADSPANDGGNDVTCGTSPVNGIDQRQIVRPQGPHCDIGAYESEIANPCAAAPAKPVLVSPANGTTIQGSKAKLSWNTVYCGYTYRAEIRQDFKKGELVTNKATGHLNVGSKKLETGHTYFWRVIACNTFGCTASKYFKFKLQ